MKKYVLVIAFIAFYALGIFYHKIEPNVWYSTAVGVLASAVALTFDYYYKKDK